MRDVVKYLFSENTKMRFVRGKCKHDEVRVHSIQAMAATPMRGTLVHCTHSSRDSIHVRAKSDTVSHNHSCTTEPMV